MSDISTSKQPAEQFAEELKTLHDRVEKMERLLRGTSSVIGVISYYGMIDHMPDDQVARRDHASGLEMLEMVNDELAAWRKSERGLDFPSDDVWSLMDAAKHGKLILCGKYQPDPVA